MRLLRLLLPCLAAALLVPAAAQAKEGPRSTAARVKKEVPLAIAPPATIGPVRVPADLVLRTLHEEDEDENLIPIDDRPESPLYQPRLEWGTRGIAAPSAASAFGANVRINTLVGTPAGNGEAEVSMAAIGNKLISGWNDGQFWQLQPGFVGYGYSIDGGATWTDGGSLPVSGATDIFYGDPVIVADPAGHWYFADLWRPSPTVTGITVSHGTFAGAAPAWDPPVAIATHATDYLDKPWLGVDPTTGNVYCAYVRFLSAGGQRIEWSRSVDHGAHWSAPITITASTTYPMAPRIQVGPTGQVYLAYYSYDASTGNEYERIRKSTDGGLSFGPETNIGGRPFLNNYYSGPAGYNRERMVALVSFDVDRSTAPSRGKLYAVWQEGLDVNNDVLGGTGSANEIEANESSAAATPFTLGQALLGGLSSTADQDWWSFAGTAGQTVIFYLVPNGSSCNGFLRLHAGGGSASNRVALSHFSGGVALVEFTLPSTGTYYLRVGNWDGVGTNIGNYVVYSGTHTSTANDIARDHRDVIVSSSSDEGATWSTPVVVNDDPARYDDAWPEVAVDAAGRVHVDWYDHRDDAANGILTSMYYTRSDDRGKTFKPSARFSTGSPINWNNVATNIFPNMGDYSALVADGMNVYANWADGRDGTPDSYFSKLVDATTAVEPPAAVARTFGVRGLQPLHAGRVRAMLSLPRAGAASVELLDVTGRRVAAADYPAAGDGDHVVELGQGLGPGMYFLRAHQAGGTVSGKAVALK